MITKTIEQEILEIKETFTINALDGKETLQNVGQQFLLGDGVSFWTANQSGPPTAAISVQMSELVRGATFAEIFNSFKVDLNQLCLTGAQIINFCKKYSSEIGAETFFLFQSDSYFFVAILSVNASGRYVIDVQPLRNDSIYRVDLFSRYVVVPKFDM